MIYLLRELILILVKYWCKIKIWNDNEYVNIKDILKD